MRYFILLVAFMFTTLTYAHPKTAQEKLEVYKFIKQQLDEGKIDKETAQTMWIAYMKCCED